MAVTTTPTLVDALRQSQLLDPKQLEEVTRTLQAKFPDPRLLARELMQRNWLTPYQVNQLFQGKGRELLLGSYVLLERLGEGGMGQVFKARHQKMGRIIALKLIRKDRLANPVALRRFEQEIRAAAQLSHPNIVTAHDAAQVGETHFLVMEYVEGVDLAKLVRDSGPLPVEQACAYVRQAALGLQHAQERGLIHRDIKPSNLLLAVKEGLVKVLDLGLARLPATSSGDTVEPLTELNAVVGTPDFAAPEQIRHPQLADHRADLYSLGCTFYFLLSGQPPFRGESMAEVLVKHQLEEPTPIEALNRGVPTGLAAVVRRLMAKQPDDRYQTAGELAAILEAGLNSGKWPAVGASPVTIRVARPNTGVLLAAANLPLAMTPSTSKTVTALRLTSHWSQRAARQSWELSRRLWHLGDTRPRVRLGVVGTLAGLFLLFVAWLCLRDTRQMLDRLDARELSAADRAVVGPVDGLVGVIGDQRFRHWARLRSLAYTPDGKLLATGGDDGFLRVWDAGTGVQQQALPLNFPVYRVLLLPNQRIATTDNWGNLKVWELGTGKDVPFPAGRFLGMSEDSVATTGANNAQVKVWNAATGQERTVFSGHLRNVVTVAFSRTGQLAASGGDDQTVQVWDAATGRPRWTLRGHTASVQHVQFRAAGKQLMSYDNAGVVKSWQLPSEKEFGSYTSLALLGLSPDGLTAAALGGDRSPRLLEFPTLRERATLRHDGGVGAAAFSFDSRLVATAPANYGDALKLWESASGVERPLRGNVGPQAAVLFSPDNATLAAGGLDGVVRLWDVAAGSERQFAPNQGDWFTAARFSPDGKTLALVNRNHTVKLWDVTTRAERAVLTGHQRPITSINFTRDGRTLATGSEDMTVKLWDVASAQVLANLRHQYYLGSVSFSRDDKLLLTSDWYSVKIWDVGRGLVEKTLPAPKVGVACAALAGDDRTLATSILDGVVQFSQLDGGEARVGIRGFRQGAHLAFSPDGKVLAARSFPDGLLKLWDMAASKELASIRGSATWAWSPDSRSVAVAIGDNGQLQLWDVAEGKARFPLEGHTKRVDSLSYAPDGRSFASAGQDGLVILWDPESRRKKVQAWQLPGTVNQVVFAPDGRHLVTVNANGSVYILRINPASDKNA